MIVELDEKNYKSETSTGLKLVDFYTTWCKFCNNQESVLKELSDNGFWIGKLDCDKHSDIANSLGITGFPGFILYKNGKIETQFFGFHTKSQLLNKLMNHI